MDFLPLGGGVVLFVAFDMSAADTVMCEVN